MSWSGKKVLVTGHTGFKGSWLTLLLYQLGAEVIGISLRDEKSRLLYSDANLSSFTSQERYLDIRDTAKLNAAIHEINPDYVFHLAAQALVRNSVHNPLETITTNVIGSVNVILASLNCSNVRGITVATTDKVYENLDSFKKFKESDKLGGRDPYSASKSATELIIGALRQSNNPNKIPITTVRAGNVVGGGDWGEERLIPDLVRAIQSGQSLRIRYPNATRPWQYILDCLNGYLKIAQLQGSPDFESLHAVNIGPQNSISVMEVIDLFQSENKSKIDIKLDESNILEHSLLSLDTDLAVSELGIKHLYDSHNAISLTANWYAQYLKGEDPQKLMFSEIESYRRARNEM